MAKTLVLSDSLVIHDGDLVRVSTQNLYLEYNPNNKNDDVKVYLKGLNKNSGFQKFIVKILDSGKVKLYQNTQYHTSAGKWISVLDTMDGGGTKTVNGHKVGIRYLDAHLSPNTSETGRDQELSFIPHGGNDVTIMTASNAHLMRYSNRVVAGDSTAGGGQKYDDLKFEIHPINESKPILVQDRLTFNQY
ncbi:hypothetical protein L4C34_18135 [Vibrio profundum]|uniref:hypothetical protein n=1 Tax=Vibrio profundum TaxID=2910247 RepID=UPI003D1514AE